MNAKVENVNIATNSEPVVTTPATSGVVENKDDNYSKDFVEKLKGEKENFKTKTQQLETELAQFKAQKSADEEKRLKDEFDDFFDL